MTKIILHKQIYRTHPRMPTAEINSTLCGRRGNYMPDGFGNVADKDSEVNCELCKRVLVDKE